MPKKILYIFIISLQSTMIFAQVVAPTHITCSEKDQEIKFTFALEKVSTTDTYIHYNTISKSSEENTDFEARDEVVKIPKGKKSIEINIPIIKDDECEGKESFIINWSTIMVDDPDFDDISVHWTPIKGDVNLLNHYIEIELKANRKASGLKYKKKQRLAQYSFETNPETIYGGFDETNKVVEVDVQSQGYQIIPVKKGFEHKVSFLASRRIDSTVDKSVDLHIKVLDPQTDKLIASRSIVRTNTTFKLTEEVFYFTPQVDSVKLMFLTDHNHKTYGILLDMLFIATVKGNEIQVDIEDCEKPVPIKVPAVVTKQQAIPKDQRYLIHFDHDSYSIISKKESISQSNKAFLKELLHHLQQDKQRYVELVGHTDCNGSEIYNQHLSDKRVLAIKEYLMTHGVSESQVKKYVGDGETHPLVQCECGISCTKKNNASNRRVTILLTQ